MGANRFANNTVNLDDPPGGIACPGPHPCIPSLAQREKGSKLHPSPTRWEKGRG
jgi:hypothetical protein